MARNPAPWVVIRLFLKPNGEQMSTVYDEFDDVEDALYVAGVMSENDDGWGVGFRGGALDVVRHPADWDLTDTDAETDGFAHVSMGPTGWQVWARGEWTPLVLFLPTLPPIYTIEEEP